MAERKGPTPSDYAVGYRRPPKATRFQPGRSGNPRGRPKGRRTIGAMLQEIIQQKVAVTENGKTRRMSTLEVIFRRLVNDAMRNDARALKLLLSILERQGDSPEGEAHSVDLQAEDLAILAQYRQELSILEPSPLMAPEAGSCVDDV
jgi:Family of unknown function (DUF5681)